MDRRFEYRSTELPHGGWVRTIWDNKSRKHIRDVTNRDTVEVIREVEVLNEQAYEIEAMEHG